MQEKRAILGHPRVPVLPGATIQGSSSWTGTWLVAVDVNRLGFGLWLFCAILETNFRFSNKKKRKKQNYSQLCLFGPFSDRGRYLYNVGRAQG